MRSLRFLVPLLAPFLLGSSADADEVHLQGGTVLRGVVLSGDDAPVRLLLPGGDIVDIARADVKDVRSSADAPATGAHLQYKAPVDQDDGTSIDGGLDVAVTYYVHPDGGPRVELVGAVHIGDAAYYRECQRILDRASVVLYEGVKPKDSTAADFEKPQTAEQNPVRALQNKIATWFGLVFQLDEIDYARTHFVHADMTAEEFAGQSGTTEEGSEEAPKSKPDGASAMKGKVKQMMTLFKMFGPMLDNMMGSGGEGGPARKRLKRVFARVLGTIDVQNAMAGMAPELASLVLDQRNAVVIKRLGEQRTRKDVESIAIFYGAAHMAGLEADLVKQGYQRAGARWLRAWHVQ